ncbi:hypothetical protein ACPOL_3435 [Acidisarcina polymorpha]|uniref:Uncharacterized protein n=1 Tax=Acidisarcina polymorpha TaxID=2211140 RepID=A0A2Z5G0T6_9BACT|nr:hypothetical protein [Acidisarcina polymorpha]AXC12722.1 hypothetical protein ACPOL_3435 [Acidisarcina polymorpha]
MILTKIYPVEQVDVVVFVKPHDKEQLQFAYSRAEVLTYFAAHMMHAGGEARERVLNTAV